MAIITIVGAGMMGSAMSVPARANGHAVRIVGTHLDREIIDALKETGEHPRMRRRLPDGVSFAQTEALEEMLDGADLVIGGVSSFGVDWFGRAVLPKVPDGVPVLSVTKGLTLEADGALTPFPVTLARMQPGRLLSLNAVGGPCTSYELADRHQTEVVFCGADLDTLQTLRALLETDFYHISLSTDVMGVETAVALKNAYALGVTMAVGMAERNDGPGCAEHYNSEAALFGQSVREMTRLLALFGGGAQNIVYGAGDLFVTIFGGRTRLLGTLLGRGLTMRAAMDRLEGITLESVVIAGRMAEALKAKARRGEADLSDYPLMMHVASVLAEDLPGEMPWDLFRSIHG